MPSQKFGKQCHYKCLKRLYSHSDSDSLEPSINENLLVFQTPAQKEIVILGRYWVTGLGAKRE